jgi:hypothetical protein
VFVQKRKLEYADLYEKTFTNFGLNAVEILFSEEEVKEIFGIDKKIDCVK